MNRRNFSAGVAIPVTSVYKLDIGYLHVNTPGRRGRIAENPVPPAGATVPLTFAPNTGAYALKADVISATLNITF